MLAIACSPQLLLEVSLRLQGSAGAPCPCCLEGPAGLLGASLSWQRVGCVGGVTSSGTGKPTRGQIATHGAGYEHSWYVL